MTIYEIGNIFLKISSTSVAKGSLYFEETEKIKLSHGLDIHHPDFLVESINEIAEIQQRFSNNQKFVIILPFFLTTSRIFNLPVSTRNKINMMIPFQLDESLPLGSQSMHWIEQVYKVGKKSSNICLSLINKDVFQRVHTQLNSINLYPSLVTSELSIYLGLVEIFKKPKFTNKPLPSSIPNGNFVILDMGETQTTGYFFSQGHLIFNHYSNIGSSNIDENISDNYDLSLKEARQFKEEDGFLFSSLDYEFADEDQKIFAKLMEKTLEPLTLDFAKWDLAFRSKTSTTLDKCYIVGGMSKMQNINNFLSEQLEVTTDILSLPHFAQSEEYTEYFTHQAVAVSLFKSGKIGNFLKDQFRLSSGSSSLAENTGFFLSKSLILSLFLIFFLSIERTLLEINSESMDSDFKSALKSKTLEIDKKDQVSYRNNKIKLKRLIKPRLEKIQENKSALGKKLNIPYDLLIDEITAIKNIKNIEVQKLSIFENSISSMIKVNDKKTIDDIKKRYGKSVKDLKSDQFEITIRKL